MPERVFNLPDLGEGLEDAEIAEWKVAEGDAVELNQPLVDVNTAKALVEIPSPFAGTVVKLHGRDGDVVKVGEPLVTLELGGGGEEPAAAEPSKREAVLVGYGVGGEQAPRRRRRLRPPGVRTARGAVAEAEAVEAVPPRRPPTRTGRVAAAPPVRKLARELGVDLAGLEGTGPGGRVTREDVTSASGEKPVVLPTGDEDRIPVRGIRRMVAEKMARSWAEVPHVTTFHTVDATHIEALRRELTDDAGLKVTALPIVIRALVEICREHPKLNASFDAEAGELVLKRRYHVGVATDTDQGLVVPVVRDAGDKGIVTLGREIAALVEAARSRRATPEQLTGGTITVTNVGTFGSEFGTPIINVPEVAILALGTIRQRPMISDGQISARPAVTLSLSFDHRVIDGADADRAMAALRRLLESPFQLGALPRE